MIHFVCFGRPQPQGSKTPWLPRYKGGAFVVGKNGQPVIATMDSNKKLKPWRQELRRAALEANRAVVVLERDVPVCVRLDFYLARPKSLPMRFERPTKKPDIDKLTRAVFDSLTGTIITDDSQIVEAMVGKWFGLPERVEIFVELAQPAQPLLVSNFQFQEMGPQP
jgi:crossover junction endodeoxyribonuclease RusA